MPPAGHHIDEVHVLLQRRGTVDDLAGRAAELTIPVASPAGPATTRWLDTGPWQPAAQAHHLAHARHRNRRGAPLLLLRLGAPADDAAVAKARTVLASSGEEFNAVWSVRNVWRGSLRFYGQGPSLHILYFHPKKRASQQLWLPAQSLAVWHASPAKHPLSMHIVLEIAPEGRQQ